MDDLQDADSVMHMNVSRLKTITNEEGDTRIYPIEGF